MSGEKNDPRLEVLAELRKQTALHQSMDVTLKAILHVLGQGRATGQPDAPRVDLDNSHGNPKLRFLPRDWSGSAEFKGMLFSECPPDLLDLVADSLNYFASKADDEKKKRYDTVDAARARGWAARLRSGYVPPVAAPRVDETRGEPTW